MITNLGGTAMGKGAKQPTPEASLSPKSDTMTEHRNSVLTTANQNIWTEMLKKHESFAKVAPATFPLSALNSRVPSRVASPVEFRPKIQASYNNINFGFGLPTQAQIFPQRRRSSLPGSGGAYELVSGFGRKSNDGSRLPRKISHLIDFISFTLAVGSSCVAFRCSHFHDYATLKILPVNPKCV